jgi:hypothetical protein
VAAVLEPPAPESGVSRSPPTYTAGDWVAVPRGLHPLRPNNVSQPPHPRSSSPATPGPAADDRQRSVRPLWTGRGARAGGCDVASSRRWGRGGRKWWWWWWIYGSVHHARVSYCFLRSVASLPSSVAVALAQRVAYACISIPSRSLSLSACVRACVCRRCLTRLSAMPSFFIVWCLRPAHSATPPASPRYSMQQSTDAEVRPLLTVEGCGAEQLRVRVEIMGSQKCRIVGKSQSVLIMINLIIFTRTRRTAMAHAESDRGLWTGC